MVLAQMYLPQHVGLASGLSVGLAMGLGGIAAVALGAVADAVDLETRSDLQRVRAAARRRALLLPACPEAADPGCDGHARAIPSARLTLADPTRSPT